MAERPADYHSSADEDTRVVPDRDPFTGPPRWVKVFAIVALVLALLVLILTFSGGLGDHSPARHFGGQAPPSNVVDDAGRGGHAPPDGGHR